MPPPVFVLTGQLAAGKSTLAVAIARAFPLGVHLDLDGIREMVVSGLASPLEWTDETTRQFGLAFDAAAAMASVYHQAGFVIVIEGGAPPADIDRSLDGVGLLAHRVGVVLHPSLEVALERNRTRRHKGFDTSVLDDVIRSIDADLRRESDPAGWHRIDNGGETVETTVRRILDLAPGA